MASTPNGINALFARVPLVATDQATFATVKSAVEIAFSAPNVKSLLKSVQQRSLRIRDFEDVVKSGALGPQTAAEYARLPDGDQGQIRELYLALIEQVELPLRNKFFKVYAYY